MYNKLYYDNYIELYKLICKIIKPKKNCWVMSDRYNSKDAMTVQILYIF